MYGWHEGDPLVHQLVAEREESLRALWSVVGSGASTARTVHAYVGPRDPLHLLLPATAEVSGQTQRWMLRLLDLPAAIAARGFPAGISAEVPLHVNDDENADATGSWLLRVAAGARVLERAAVERGAVERRAVGRGATQLGARCCGVVRRHPDERAATGGPGLRRVPRARRRPGRGVHR